ncbi:MAG: hypothetical protein ACKN9Y_07960 [Bacteroidota bacterium]
MKTKYVSIIAMIGFALILSSCSDSSTNPTPSNDYFPVTAGSYFVYNNIRLDSTTGNRDMTALQVDSLVVLAATNKENKTAYPFDVYRLNQKIRTDYYAKDGQTVWGFWKYIPPGITLSELINTIVPQNYRWSKFADFAATGEWTIADTTITGLSIPFNGQNIPLSSNINMKGKKIGTTTETINGNTFPNTTQFELTVTLKPSITIFGNVFPIDPIPVKQTIWVAKSVGIVKEEFPSLDLKVLVPGLEPITYKGDGYVKELLRYSVK